MTDQRLHVTDTTGPWRIRDAVPISEIAVPVVGLARYDRGLATAAVLAERWVTPVRLLHIRSVNDEVGNDELEAVRAAFQAQHPSLVVRSSLVSDEDPVEGLAGLLSADALVVMATDHASRDGRQESVAESVLRRLETPVLLVGKRADAEHVVGPVLLAVDGSPTAEGAVGPAVRFAEALGTSLRLVQVIDSSTTAHVSKLRSGGQQVSESAYLRDLTDRLIEAGHDVYWKVVRADDPVEGLLRAAGELNAGPIVVGSHGDSGVLRRMLGSTAMGLVEASRFPVLVVVTGGRDEPVLARDTSR